MTELSVYMQCSVGNFLSGVGENSCNAGTGIAVEGESNGWGCIFPKPRAIFLEV